jgi:hypothetical protein
MLQAGPVMARLDLEVVEKGRRAHPLIGRCIDGRAHQPAARACDGDIEQTPFFAPRFRDGHRFPDAVRAEKVRVEKRPPAPKVWPDVGLHTCDDDDVPLQALAAVSGHHSDAASVDTSIGQRRCRDLLCVDLGDERG